MKLLLAPNVIFECLWCVQTTRAMFAHAVQLSLFFRRSTHACVARTVRPVLSSVSAWPFQQGARHRCAGASTHGREFRDWTVGRTFPRWRPGPLLPTPLTHAKVTERVPNVLEMETARQPPPYPLAGNAGWGRPTLRTGDTVECKMIRQVMDEVSNYAGCG